jgi:hypothetical protein
VLSSHAAAAVSTARDRSKKDVRLKCMMSILAQTGPASKPTAALVAQPFRAASAAGLGRPEGLRYFA